MEKYRILWLDDELAEKKPFSETVTSFEQGQDEFKIDRAESYNDFEEKYRLHNYDGVILDIFGDISAEQTEHRNERCPFDMALELLKTEKIVKIVYSGKIDEHPDQQSSLEFKAKQEGAIFKNKGKMCVDQLFDKVIRPNLEDKFSRDFPEYYEMKESLSKEIKSRFDKVRDLYNKNIDKSEPFQESDFDDIRKLIEGVFKTHASKKKIVITNQSTTLGDCLGQLEKKCHNKFVKPALDIIRAFSNPSSHFNEAKTVDYPGYGKYVYRALFNELFMCLKWYYCDLLPTKGASAKNEEECHKAVDMPEPTLEQGKVEQDEDGNMHLGNVLLPYAATKWVGQEVRLMAKSENTREKTKSKYPLFARFEPVEESGLGGKEPQ